MSKTWTENGLIYGNCHVCGQECNTHDDAAYTLDYCGDCGNVTCQDHRSGQASRCSICEANRNA